jgi:hypothetical protein
MESDKDKDLVAAGLSAGVSAIADSGWRGQRVCGSGPPITAVVGGAMGGGDQLRARLKGDRDGRPMLNVFSTANSSARACSSA